MNTTLIKTSLRQSIAESILAEIRNRNANYYFYIGKTLEWFLSDQEPDIPIDNIAYEQDARNRIIGMKSISPSEVSLVIDRINWTPNTVYDMYDDSYGSQIVGVNLINGGSGYVNAPTVTIDGNGEGATAKAVVENGRVVDVIVQSGGTGYTEATITFSADVGTGASASIVFSTPSTGNTGDVLEDTNFYTITDDFNVYKCLDNNGGAQSTVKPTSTSLEPIALSDGYVWKYMYNVPLSLRTKFLGADFIPILTSVSQQYYSNGTINRIDIQSSGSGYSYANLAVSGDGFLEDNPQLLTGVVVEAGGTGYESTDELLIEPPFDSADWVSEGTVLRGEYIKTSNPVRVYQAVNGGTFGTVEPVHEQGIVQNGSVSLEYIGKSAIGEITVSAGEVTDVTLLGEVSEINLTAGGSGYLTPPNVTVVGTNATAEALLGDNGAVSSINVVDGGDDTLSTSPTVVLGEEWQPSTYYEAGSQLFVADRLYTVVNSGTSGTTTPTHLSGTQSDGGIDLSYAGEAAKANSSLRFGEGYQERPNASVISTTGTGAELFVQTTKSNAKLNAIIDNGQVVGVEIIKGGVAYTTATITVSGDGEGAVLNPNLSVGDINTRQADVELLARDGEISAVVPVSEGYGYTNATVTVEGDGEGAVIEPVLDGGKIVSYDIFDRGLGYRTINLVINGDGEGAKARVILPPTGGHGANAVKELFARTMVLYSDISFDKYNGFSINNDYRQIGIIKNPKSYENGFNIRSQTSSSCWVASSADLNTITVEPDDNVFDTNGNKYIVVTTQDKNIMLLSVEGGTLSQTDTITTEEGFSLQLENVGEPQVDKFSGDMLFVDNRIPFAPSSQEIVNLRTVLRF